MKVELGAVYGRQSGDKRLGLTIMPLKQREVRVMFMVGFQSILQGLAYGRRDGPELRTAQVPQVAWAAGHP